MKNKLPFVDEKGSVLMVSMMTITILTMICATSLYVTSQSGTTAMQTAAWQQALTGAESGVDKAIAALNTGVWTNWKTVATTTLPTSEPAAGTGSTTTGEPDSTHYSYFPSSQLSLTQAGEGATTVSTWATIDTAGMLSSQDSNGSQWYRVRATGQASLSGPARVSANKLDDNLRNTISLRFNRKGGNTLGPSRTIEVILQPLSSNLFARALLMKNSINMSGGSYIDSFKSTDPFKSTNGVYDPAKRQSHGDVATLNSTSSDLRSMYVYGGLSYSGPAVRNTTNVQGTISTPYSSTITSPSDPVWTAGSYTTMANLASTQTINAGTKQNPLLIKVTGSMNLSGANILTLAAANSGTDNNYITIWIQGSMALSGSAQLVQQSGVKVTFYVDKAINFSGGAVVNGNNLASTLTINGTGDNIGDAQNAIMSGSQAFYGVINAPSYNFDVSGSAVYSGAFIGNSINLSGGASIHYDEALKSNGASAIGNYAFASWFEDDSDKARSITY